MKRDWVLRVLMLIAVALGGLFVWTTGEDLPSLVGTRFYEGQATRFTTREIFLGVAFCCVVGVPLLMAFSARWITVLPPRLARLPNAIYWLAQERLSATLDGLAAYHRAMALILLFYFCHMYWIFVQATVHSPTIFHS
ncbi:MAG: hypothetical protein M3Z16_07370 [Pseudomonadota bacterium]|nr:hypothetical protein [Pseudomonadota bacterium]